MDADIHRQEVEEAERRLVEGDRGTDEDYAKTLELIEKVSKIRQMLSQAELKLKDAKLEQRLQRNEQLTEEEKFRYDATTVMKDGEKVPCTDGDAIDFNSGTVRLENVSSSHKILLWPRSCLPFYLCLLILK